MNTQQQTTLLDARNGAQLWQRSWEWLASDKGMAMEADGILYALGASSMKAVDTRNWNILWTLPADPDGSFTTPVLFQHILFASAQATPPHVYNPGSGQDAVVAINPSNGSVYWSVTTISSFIGVFSLT